MGFEPGRAGADAAATAAGEAAQEAWAALLKLAEQRQDRQPPQRRDGLRPPRLHPATRCTTCRRAALPFYGPDGIRKAVGGTGTRLALG